MKRLVLLVLILSVVLGVSTIYAQGMGRAFAVKIDTAKDGAIKLDGVLDKENEPWKFAIPVYIVVDTANGGILTPVWQQFGTHTNDFDPAGGKHRGIMDTSALVYILWDATNLYVATAQYDDVILGGPANPWETDSIEMYVGSGAKPNWTIQPLRVELSVWDGKAPAAGIVTQPDVMKSAVKLDFDGGRLWTESIITLKKFGLDGTKIAVGQSVSFDFEIDDTDNFINKGQRSKIAWASGGNGMWNTPALAGMLTFLDFPPADYR